SRPYRSHKYPACSFCRRRKSRCTRELNSRSCLLCRLHGLECSQDGQDVARDSGQGSRRLRPVRRRSRSEQSVVPSQPNATSKSCFTGDAPKTQLTSPEPPERPDSVVDEDSAPVAVSPENTPNKPSRHIVGPTDAPDVQVLEKYMSPDSSRMSNARRNTIYLDDPTNPIVYVKVPRQRIVASIGNGSAGYKQLETIEKILEPLGDQVVQLYFDSFHRAFPLLDEGSIFQAYKDNKLPHTLVCELYAVALVAWNKSETLSKSRPQPDMKYVWRQTVDALNEEYQAPAFWTILATILDLAGRPTTIMTYNALNIGRSVALSRSLGLNRNPSTWNLDQRQKSLRIRTWWGVLIHDWWASLTHGTPPHIFPTQYDVPIPDLNMLLPGKYTPLNNNSKLDDQLAGAQSFIALCQLTEILGEMLPLIYDLRSQRQDTSLKSLRKLELMVDNWDDSLLEWQKGSSPEFRREAPGALNLHLSFLALKMNICREAIRSDERDENGVRQYYQVRCQKAAEAVIRFVITIGSSDMDKFWLPYTCYHMASATTLILRCGLETKSDHTASECLSMAKLLIDHLRSAKDTYNWDLADICLSQCEAVVRKMSEDGQYLGFRRRN
ncbi:fungal-specific transcription factor domain-containing protein, partial [Xylogone sp. PMI_703]